MGTNVTVSMISKAICAAAHATLSQRTISDINYKASVHFAIHLSLMLKEIMTSMSTPFTLGEECKDSLRLTARKAPGVYSVPQAAFQLLLSLPPKSHLSFSCLPSALYLSITPAAYDQPVIMAR